MNQSAHNVILKQAYKYAAMSDGRYEAAELANVAVAGGAAAISALAWVGTIARCRIIDFLRMETKVSDRFKTGFEIEATAKGDDLAVVDAGIDIAILQHAAGLSCIEASVIKMRYVAGMSFKVISQKLGYASKASAWMVHDRAIKKIRSILKNN